MGKLTMNLLDCITDIQHVKTTAYHEMLNEIYHSKNMNQ